MTDHAATYNRYHAGPDTDDECPEWALDRIAALQALAHDLYRAAGPCEELERRAVELLDIDDPRVDPVDRF